MHLKTLIPLAGLVAMLAVLLLSRRSPPPLAANFGGPPEVRDLDSPELDLGEQFLEGTLLGLDGQPVEGASIFALQSGRPIWTFTGAGGGFRLADLYPGPLEVAVNAPGHLATLFPLEVGAGPVTLRLTEHIPAPEPLPAPARLKLAGRVMAPEVDLSGFEVALLPTARASEPGTGVPHRLPCDSSGNFETGVVTPAEYEILLLPPWARGGTWPNLLTGLHEPAQRIVHPSLDDLVLIPATGTVGGHAFDKARREPIVGALVVITPLPESPDSTDLRRFPPVRTGSDGGYYLEHLPLGRYRVVLTAGAEIRQAELEVGPGGVTDPGF